MVKVKEDLTGQTFERLTVICQTEDYVDPKGDHYAQWLCVCGCSEHNLVIVGGSKLKNGHTKSCGCLQKERTSISHKKYNQYSEKITDEHGEYYIGFTNNTNKEFYIDADDYDKIKDYYWYEHINSLTGYSSLETVDPKNNKHIKMHYLIFGKYCDHTDRNPLNNRKYNLRNATFSENARNKSVQKNNTSGVTGVSWDTSRNKWESRISINGKSIILGRFVEKDDAIRSRLESEKKYFREFAPQRNLFEKYNIK